MNKEDRNKHYNGWYQLDTRWGCGGVKVKDAIIIEAAPVFKKLKWQNIADIVVKGGYKITKLEEK